LGGDGQALDPLWESGGDGETPLSQEDCEALIPKHISVRRELNELEGEGVSNATLWAFRRNWKVGTLIQADFICALHRRMFQKVWGWAGSYRVRDVYVVPTSHREIRPELRKLNGDADHWIKLEQPPDEIAVRFHHRLVLIHPFPNGNGRLSRTMGNLLARALGQTPFTWGQTSVPDYRARYLEGLRLADREADISLLLDLSRKA
jgi:Fic-DOC domain mobile mystery protein B